MSKSLRQRLKDSRSARMDAEADLANLRDAVIQLSKLVPRKWLTVTPKKEREAALDRVQVLLSKRSGAAFLSEVYSMKARLDLLAAFADDVGRVLSAASDDRAKLEYLADKFVDLREALGG
jgi:hypothetical protein